MVATSGDCNETSPGDLNDLNFDLNHFLEFYEQRKARIRDRFVQTLGSTSTVAAAEE